MFILEHDIHYGFQTRSLLKLEHDMPRGHIY